MTWDLIERTWTQFMGKAKEKWGELTDDKLNVAARKRDHMIAKLQERYGYTRERAAQELTDWGRGL